MTIKKYEIYGKSDVKAVKIAIFTHLSVICHSICHSLECL